MRTVESDRGLTEVDALRGKIVVAARSRLAQLGSPAPRWWEWITDWSRVALPVGLAASMGAALLVQGTGGSAIDSATVEVGSDSTLVAAAFSQPGSESQLAASLIAPGGSDWLVEQVVSQ